jgi:hypothetical protein
MNKIQANNEFVEIYGKIVELFGNDDDEKQIGDVLIYEYPYKGGTPK